MIPLVPPIRLALTLEDLAALALPPPRRRAPRPRRRGARRPRCRVRLPLPPPGGNALDLFSPYRTSDDRPEALDVGARALDLRRIARSQRSLWAACMRAGWEEEDLHQELLLRCFRRQSMRSRYDPHRGGVPKYLTTFARSQLQNLLEKLKRRGHVVVSDDGVVDGVSWDPDPWEDEDGDLQ